MKLPFTLILLFSLSSLIAQQSIDGEIPFQTDPAKKYSLYIPSQYDEGEANKLVVAFHPLNTSRWNAESWRDTLIDFSESIQAILLCPDGGEDGKVDDPIDTAFTSFILDSIRQSYNIDESKIFGMGFSWGGRTTYTYGLNRPGLFEGHLVIGAAINGLNEIGGLVQNAELLSFYLVHGSNDALSTRYTPAKNALENANACIEGMVLQGIGHTIDFPNRNQILIDAFNWLDNRACGISNTESIEEDLQLFYPNPSSGVFKFKNISRDDIVAVYDTYGRLLNYSCSSNEIDIEYDLGMVYLLLKTSEGEIKNLRLFIH